MSKSQKRRIITVTIRATKSVIKEVLASCRQMQKGLPVESQTELAFNDAATMLSILTAKRLELLTFLRSFGPSTIKELSRQLGRNYSNIHGDVQLLLRLGLLDKTEDELIYVPFDELNICLPLAA